MCGQYYLQGSNMSEGLAFPRDTANNMSEKDANQGGDFFH